MDVASSAKAKVRGASRADAAAFAYSAAGAGAGAGGVAGPAPRQVWQEQSRVRACGTGSGTRRCRPGGWARAAGDVPSRHPARRRHRGRLRNAHAPDASIGQAQGDIRRRRGAGRRRGDTGELESGLPRL